MITVEILIPESLREAANHLACCMGKSMADMRTFDYAVRYQDDEGNVYLWVGVQVSERWLAALESVRDDIDTLDRPDFDTEQKIDLGAAAETLVNAVVFQPSDIEDMEPESDFIPKDCLVIGVGVSVTNGLTRAQEAE